MNLKDKIINSCKFVVKNAEHVKINKDKIDELCHELKPQEQDYFLKDVLKDLDLKQKVHFALVLDSMIFSFWGSEPKWGIYEDGEKLRGTFSLIHCIDAAIRTHDILNPQKLASLTKEEFREIMNPPGSEGELSMFDKRLEHLNEIGRVLIEKFESDFTCIFDSISTDSELLDVIIRSFPNFEDKEIYKDEEIYFYKRAQVLVWDILEILKLEKEFNVIKNTNALTAFADYRIPQLLRHVGILEYDDSLANLVDNKIEIPENNEMEVEMRACMLIAVEMLKEKIEEMEIGMKASDLHMALWLAAGKGEEMKPYHRTRTVKY